jgi:hypothetical protein
LESFFVLEKLFAGGGVCSAALTWIDFPRGIDLGVLCLIFVIQEQLLTGTENAQTQTMAEE